MILGNSLFSSPHSLSLRKRRQSAESMRIDRRRARKIVDPGNEEFGEEGRGCGGLVRRHVAIARPRFLDSLVLAPLCQYQYVSSATTFSFRLPVYRPLASRGSSVGPVDPPTLEGPIQRPRSDDEPQFRCYPLVRLAGMAHAAHKHEKQNFRSLNIRFWPRSHQYGFLCELRSERYWLHFCLGRARQRDLTVLLTNFHLTSSTIRNGYHVPGTRDWGRHHVTRRWHVEHATYLERVRGPRTNSNLASADEAVTSRDGPKTTGRTTASATLTDAARHSRAHLRRMIKELRTGDGSGKKQKVAGGKNKTIKAVTVTFPFPRRGRRREKGAPFLFLFLSATRVKIFTYWETNPVKMRKKKERNHGTTVQRVNGLGLTGRISSLAALVWFLLIVSP
ncbi:hypothetical protein H6P81_007769 [Aristolochia fimbriata]|uniref:Uncharacterized protein n=1 Tax=Aristolochia fimbriata TaxID=158543 RepID=A0AAV7F166_ARIFI|nr:hypothetical protein H6P81_007769 [Aristolochia fimbriata]